MQESAVQSYGTWLGGVLVLEKELKKREQAGTITEDEKKTLEGIQEKIESLDEYAKLYQDKEDLYEKNEDKPILIYYPGPPQDVQISRAFHGTGPV